MAAAVRPVEVPYALLLEDGQEACAKVDALIEEAFGPDGLGLLTISGVPGFVAARQRLLPLAAKLAALPPAALARLEHPSSRYSVGWSHGREALGGSGRADVHKGSFYANPTTDDPAGEDPTVTRADVERYPGYFQRNVWPAAAAGAAAAGAGAGAGAGLAGGSASSSLPELEPAFKALGRIVVDAGLLLAERCDAYVRRAWKRRRRQHRQQRREGQQEQGEEEEEEEELPPSSLAEALRASQCHKARLLHYFPPGAGAAAVAARDAATAGGAAAAEAAAAAASPARPDHADNNNDEEEEGADGWCGWHRDHGALTGLTCAMYTRPSLSRAPRLSCADDANGAAAFAGGGDKKEQEEEQQQQQHFSPRPASPPDARAGLYVRTRSGRVARADIPPDHLAFQVGQAAAICSGGLLCATPHCVRAPLAGRDVSRETFAVFLQPDVRAPLRVPATAFAMPSPTAAAAAAAAPAAGSPPPPPVAKMLRSLLLSEDSGQYRAGDSFGDFAERTVRGNYDGAGGGKVAAAGAAGVVRMGARAGEGVGSGGGADGNDAANPQDSPGRREKAAAATVYVVHE